MSTNKAVKVDFDNKEDAIDTLAQLRQAIRQYGRVTFAALSDLIGIEPIYDDTLHGWSRLEDEDAHIKQVKDEYILVLPPMEDFGEVEQTATPVHRRLTKKHLAIIAGSVIGLGLVAYIVNRTELGFNLKKKGIRRLMASQIEKNKRPFVQYYSGDTTFIPKEAAAKIGAAVEEIMKTYDIEVRDI